MKRKTDVVLLYSKTGFNVDFLFFNQRNLQKCYIHACYLAVSIEY